MVPIKKFRMVKFSKNRRLLALQTIRVASYLPSMEEPKLFMVLLGCRPPGRLTEQHDIFFGVAPNLKSLAPAMKASWKGAKVHIDAWREVNAVDGYRISVVAESDHKDERSLFFVNLGGYRPGEFEEYHYKILSVGTMAEAVSKAKATAFYRHFGFEGAVSHVDDKFGIDLDDLVNVGELFRNNYRLSLTPDPEIVEDQLHIGYLSMDNLLKS